MTRLPRRGRKVGRQPADESVGAMRTDVDTSAEEERVAGGLGGVVKRGVFFSGAGFFLSQGITIASSVVLARLVSPEEFGIYGSATILLGYAGMFADSGMQAAVIQRRDRVSEAASTAFAANVVSGVGLALLALAVAPVVGIFFHNSTVGHVAAVMAGVITLDSLLLVPDALLQRRFSFVRRLFVSPSAAITFGLVAGIACAEGMGVWGLVLGRYTSLAVEVIVIWALGWLASAPRARVVRDVAEPREYGATSSRRRS